MNAPSKGSPPETRHIRPIDVVSVVYLVLVLILILVFHRNLKPWWLYAIAHLAGIAVVVALARVNPNNASGATRFLRDWYPTALFLACYEEAGWLNHLVGNKTHEWLPIAWDKAIFGDQPSLEFSRRLTSPLFAEYMSLSYMSFYVMIMVFALALYLRPDREPFADYIFRATLTFFFCFLIFILFPTVGPQYVFADEPGRPLQGKVFGALLRLIFRFGEVQNGALPSSHCAVSLVVLLSARLYKSRLFWPLMVLTASLWVSTVYIRSHYFVDVPAGLIIGAAFFFYIAPKTRALLSTHLARHNAVAGS